MATSSTADRQTSWKSRSDMMKGRSSRRRERSFPSARRGGLPSSLPPLPPSLTHPPRVAIERLMRLVVPEESFDVRIDFPEEEVSASRLVHAFSALLDVFLLSFSSSLLVDPGALFPLFFLSSTNTTTTLLSPLSFGLYTRVFVLAMCVSSLINETVTFLLWKQTSHLLRYGLAPQRWASLFASDILSVLALSHPVGSRLLELILLSVGLVFAADCLVVLQDLLVRPASSSEWKGPFLMRVSLPLLYLSCQTVLWTAFFLLLRGGGGGGDESSHSSSAWLVPVSLLLVTRVGVCACTLVGSVVPPSRWIRIDPLVCFLVAVGRIGVVSTFLVTRY